MGIIEKVVGEDWLEQMSNINSNADHGDFYLAKDGTHWYATGTGERWRRDGIQQTWVTEAEWEQTYGFAAEKEPELEIVEQPVKRGRGRPRKEVTEAKKFEADAKDALMDLFVMGAKQKVLDSIQSAAAEATQDIVDYVDAIHEEILSYEKKKITVIGPAGVKELHGTRHDRFEQLLTVVGAGLSAMMVGPAGSGKTYASEQVAEALDFPFYSISVGSQTSKSDLFGYMDGGGTYRSTFFRQAYEFGGVFLMDEIDAGNANVLVLMNSALAGSQAAFPDQKMVQKHENFRFIATANTFGTGASRQYVGRNQLDAATLDRFVTIEWPIDLVLEASTVAHYTNGSRWHNVVQQVRRQVDSNQWRVVVSPRATMKGALLLDAGLNFDQVVEMVLLGSAAADQRPQIVATAKGAW